MKKLSEVDIIKKINEILFEIIKDMHHLIIEGNYQSFVPVESDPDKFCNKALKDIKIVMPYYFREYVKKEKDQKNLHDHKSNIFSLEKLAYVYIKSIMHVRMFSPNRGAIYDFLDQGNELDFRISYPTAYTAAYLVYMTYKLFPLEDNETTPFFSLPHCIDICVSLCELLEHLSNDLPDITPGLVSYIWYALRLSHKNVTARTTTQLLARDALIPLLTSWVTSNDKIGLIHFDIDFFSQVNNDNDHKIGDDCLVQIASKVCAFSEQYNGACERHGGEEFVIALPIPPAFNFHEHVDLLLESIREVKRPNYQKSDKVKYKPFMSATISYGIIEKNNFINNSFIETYDQALNLLDQAVVMSKREDVRDVKIYLEKLY